MTVEDMEEGYGEAVMEQLAELAASPINLNQVIREQLEALPFLTAIQVEEIMEYIYRYAPIRSLGELKMIHQGLVLELSLETTRITNTIPRFNADERRLFVVRTPEGNHWCTEGNRHLRLSCLIQQFSTMQLALVNLDRVVAPGIV